MDGVDPNIIIPAIIVGLTTALATIFSFLGNRNAKRANVHAAQVNDAVNNTHPGAPKLYDLALSNQARIRSTHRRLDELHDANEYAKAELANRLDAAVADGRRERSLITQALADHVASEEQGQYPELMEELRKIQDLLREQGMA